MTKLIRVKNETFDALVDLGKWTDTMDDIIVRLLDTQSDNENCHILKNMLSNKLEDEISK